MPRPKLDFPQFDGSQSKIWQTKCETYFEVCGISPNLWVRMATMHFVGNAAYWAQSAEHRLRRTNWDQLCKWVCDRFGRDQHQQLIFQLFHLRRLGTVAEYVEQFEALMEQLLSYSEAVDPMYFVTRFIDGLRDDIRHVVLVHRPRNLDTTISLAGLQEKANDGGHRRTPFKSDVAATTKFSPKTPSALPLPLPPGTVKSGIEAGAADRRGTDATRASDVPEKLEALRAYCRARGLCYKCREKWSHEHRCVATVQLHILEELLELLQISEEYDVDTNNVELRALRCDDLMVVSQHAVRGAQTSRTVCIVGEIQHHQVLMLIDSRSSHSFIADRMVSKLTGVSQLVSPVKVKVADGGLVPIDRQFAQCAWRVRGVSFLSDFKVFPLGYYDVILGMDWLEVHSPMQMNWGLKTMKFEYEDKEVFIQGLSGVYCSFISGNFSIISIASNLSLWREVNELCAAVDIVTEEEVPNCIVQVLHQFSTVFGIPTELPPHRAWDHHIPLLPGSRPVNILPYHHSPAQKDEIEHQVADMLKAGIIRHSSSPFSSSVLLVPKKDKSWRFCVDFRHLNAMTVENKFPLPIIDEFLDELAHAAWFTQLDFCSGFHQIRMASGEEFKTAFQTHSGHYEFCVMPFGLSGAPPTFQGAMNQMLAPMLRKYVLVFMDDILIYSLTLEDHVQHLAQVLSVLKAHQFQVKRSKCSFAQRRLAYLGHVISEHGVATDPEKVSAVRDWPSPTNAKELRSFLGLAGYYRKFVRHFGIISSPLTELLKKNTLFIWTSEKGEFISGIEGCSHTGTCPLSS
uniref:Reverse transcriptase domain-containing protein n=1 Tax=Arundo donax TaxID=35708 RepID=A0A0A9G9I5_ARUDO